MKAKGNILCVLIVIATLCAAVIIVASIASLANVIELGMSVSVRPGFHRGLERKELLEILVAAIAVLLAGLVAMRGRRRPDA